MLPWGLKGWLLAVKLNFPYKVAPQYVHTSIYIVCVYTRLHALVCTCTLVVLQYVHQGGIGNVFGLTLHCMCVVCARVCTRVGLGALIRYLFVPSLVFVCSVYVGFQAQGGERALWQACGSSGFCECAVVDDIRVGHCCVELIPKAN